ncbi:non-hydrolyzing UDP-N-acetylglucosamine 2-epimerase [Pontiella sulfatireligans]|uniref:UDP-2,3-diacetamido-2,3-dideoxy-D-glucuronate 2-epimerase n=1 Tax=Pontiella sulfatireligans TaxID=2750658 RepID=A0A6C2UDH0_9BACT|nr:UDP-N-acetylglucosamine 2-epimerase (non-hydrolyzing) [Pontiella sulfatireligans]VGO18252.1 UDP-2,3-diacetamido-2,3-dideoxy-D-glucuronate 2-epimerase [Pontiella sulfatireligans]
MKKMKIMSVVGARPNFMKIAPFAHELVKHPDQFEHFLVHTGQHYDKAMSHSFFESLNIPHPDVDLGIGSGSHAEQVGRTMIEFEKVLLEQKPDWVVVVGDVNATCACSITAKKHHIKVAHIEAGLRSFDLHMPEEINRMVTDSICDLLLTPDEFANENLRREGHAESQIKFVGNIMIDTLEANRNQAAELDLNEIIQRNLIPPDVSGQASEVSTDFRSPVSDLCENSFTVLTMHRPSNVDSKETLESLVRLLIDKVSIEMPLVWSVHPRTKKNLQRFGLWDEVMQCANIILINPVGYHEMLKLNMSAKIMLTDSGGLQEESCVLGTPCITMRESTERPVTLVEHGGVSELTGSDPEGILVAFKQFLNFDRRGHFPRLWDGGTAKRIVNALRDAGC